MTHPASLGTMGLSQLALRWATIGERLTRLVAVRLGCREQ
jgi:hypothetical protein